MVRRFHKWILALTFFLCTAIPTVSQAYFGLGVGVVDEENFGGAITAGMELPFNLGLDLQLVGFADTGATDIYWLQGNAGLRYDFHEFWKMVSETIELHPYVKGGFTYAATLVNSPLVSDIKASHGPGFHIGAGVDWKMFPLLSLGVEFTESFAYLGGATVNVAGTPVTLSPDETSKVFSFLVMLKFFAY